MENKNGKFSIAFNFKILIIPVIGILVILLAALLFKDEIINALVDNTVKKTMSSRILKLGDGLHALLIGTSSPLPDIKRAGPCIAVIAGEKIYVVDAGDAAARNIMLAGINAGKIEAVLLTHFHSDHIAGLGEIMLQRWVIGSADKPLDVIGPAGVEKVVAGFNTAYKLDTGYRVAHHGAKTLPPTGAGGVAKPFTLAPDKLASRIIMDKDGVKITAFRVDHQPVEPAVGYKFEYKRRSLVISGDTKYSESLERQSAGVDLLLHEAMNAKLVGLINKYSYSSNSSSTAKITRDIPLYHSTPEDAAKIAQKTHVRELVLYHLIPPVPASLPKSVFLGHAGKYYDGPITLGVDGLLISLPPDSKNIEKKYLFD